VDGESKHDLGAGAPGAMQRLIMELVQSDTWLRSLVDQSPLGISISQNGITLYVNQACANLFGSSSPAEHVGTSQLTRVAPESRDTVAGYIRNRERGEAAPRTYEIKGLRKDGTVFPLYVEVSRIRLMGESVSVAFFTDFTERKQMEELLRRAHEDLEERVHERTRELAALTETLKQREAELESRTAKLEDLNVTLRTVLDQRDKDRRQLEARVLADISELVKPSLEKLRKCGLTREAATHVNILESNLREIVSPFAQHLAGTYINLTSTEIQIVNLIKQGMRSKEIAELLTLSKGTIDFYRKNVRQKLGIRNKKTNLRTFLLSRP
jgi:PAS domain S-box-containing protein